MTPGWQADCFRNAMTTLRPWLQVQLLELSRVVPIDKLQTLVDAAEVYATEAEPTMRLVFPKRRRRRKARAAVKGKKQ